MQRSVSVSSTAVIGSVIVSFPSISFFFFLRKTLPCQCAMLPLYRGAAQAVSENDSLFPVRCVQRRKGDICAVKGACKLQSKRFFTP
jgi:hypothetical protein